MAHDHKEPGSHGHDHHHHDHGHDHSHDPDHKHDHDHSHGHHHHHHDHHPADHHHDWHSKDYAADWIARDAGRTDERKAFLDQLVNAIPFPHDAAIEVLDVGAGSGVVADALLAMFPKSRVTLQDFSEPMLAGARTRFTGRTGPVRYLQGDLRDPGWLRNAGGPFDLVVSGIAIHNLHEMPAIGACYEAVRLLLKPGGCFLDYDHFDRVGGVALHQHMLKVAGFSSTEIVFHQHPTAVLKAVV